MLRAFWVMALVCVVWPLGGPAQAQVAPEDVLDPGPRTEAVDGASSWDRVQRKVIYLRPEAPFKPDERVTIKLPPKPRTNEEMNQSQRWTITAIFALILIAIVAIFISQGSRIQVSFGQARGQGRQAGTGAETATGPDVIPLDGFLERLTAMADRRAALILLVGRALERAAAANDMTLGRAQTARDVVRALPRGWMHRDTLNRLVREAEIVHFGGRDISEDRWQDCLNAARPLFAPREGTA